MSTELDEIRSQTRQAAIQLMELAQIQSRQILVIGCSTSEVIGEKIGSAGSSVIAEAILNTLVEVCAEAGVYLAIQCCEHLNRALVVEQQAALEYHLEPVMVVPVPKAGGALAAEAMKTFKRPIVIEHIKAHAGLDIGNTLIGMQLKEVAVPVRLTQKNIGQALLTAARTRPKLIGGSRAVYV
jgi:uncharacterized protein (TIGR01440 family)